VERRRDQTATARGAGEPERAVSAAALPAGQAEVLALQRAAGNSLTARWLARQPEVAARPRRTVVERFATAGRETGPVWDVVLTVTGVPSGDEDGYAGFYSACADGIQAAAGSLGGAAEEDRRTIRLTLRYRDGDLGSVTTEAFEKARASVLGPVVTIDFGEEEGLETVVDAPAPVAPAPPPAPAPVATETAEQLIERHSRGPNLREEELAGDLRGRMPAASDLVVQVLRALPSTDRDDVAFALLEDATDEQITAWGKDAGGRRVLHLALGELSSGVRGKDEAAQQSRVMGLLGDADVPAAEAAPAADASGEDPAAIVRRHSGWGNLRERELATDLLARLRAGQAALAGRVLDALSSSDRDDVAVHLLEVAEEDAALVAIARDTGGRAFLLRLVREMHGGSTADDERKQMQRVMQLISDADRGAADEAEAGGTPTNPVQVEVITYLYGGAVLDAVGTVAGGARGHTVVTVGELAYSFELGWSCGYTRSQYIAKNRFRDGIGQVLTLPKADVETIQDKLNASCGTGVYAIGGDICTDASARALESVLTTLKSGWNPGAFVGTLDDTGKVGGHRFYPKSE
jgi:hypothetical protein